VLPIDSLVVYHHGVAVSLCFSTPTRRRCCSTASRAACFGGRWHHSVSLHTTRKPTPSSSAAGSHAAVRKRRSRRKRDDGKRRLRRNLLRSVGRREGGREFGQYRKGLSGSFGWSGYYSAFDSSITVRSAGTARGICHRSITAHGLPMRSGLCETMGGARRSVDSRSHLACALRQPRPRVGGHSDCLLTLLRRHGRGREAAAEGREGAGSFSGTLLFERGCDSIERRKYRWNSLGHHVCGYAGGLLAADRGAEGRKGISREIQVVSSLRASGV
jgi:hypothetical protein